MKKLRVTEYKTALGNKGYIFTPDMTQYKTDFFTFYFSDVVTKKTGNDGLFEKAKNLSKFINVDKEIIEKFWEVFWYGEDQELDNLVEMVYNNINVTTKATNV